MQMIATRAYKYGTRHLVPGDEFEAPRMHALLLQTRNKAKPALEAAQKLAPQVDDDPLERLRQEAAQLGVDVDGRWGASRLQREIDKARSN